MLSLLLLLAPPPDLLSGDATPANPGVALRGTAAVRRDVPVDPAAGSG